VLEKGSISLLILGVADGDPLAQNLLWQRYYDKLVRLARNKLPAATRRAADEEDVAVNVFYSFYKAAKIGRFPNLADRDELWRLLFRMTARKAVDHVRHEDRQCRGGGKVRGESAVTPSRERERTQGLANVIGDEPTPLFAMMMSEQCEEMLEQLARHHETLPGIAEDKLAGYNNEEIAARHHCGLRTVERRLKLIRDIWQEHLK